VTRTLGAGIATDINAASGERCQFIQFNFADIAGAPTPVYLTTAAKDIVWNAITWQATGHMMELDALGESADDPGNGLKVKLSGVDQTILALILGSTWRGRTATIWYAALDQSTGAVKADPVIMFSGPMNGGFEIGESRGDFGGGTVDIQARLTSRLDELVKIRGVKTNVQSHQNSGYASRRDRHLFSERRGTGEPEDVLGCEDPERAAAAQHRPGSEPGWRRTGQPADAQHPTDAEDATEPDRWRAGQPGRHQ
jgi:hypothetical protein